MFQTVREGSNRRLARALTLRLEHEDVPGASGKARTHDDGAVVTAAPSSGFGGTQWFLGLPLACSLASLAAS